jgi:succinate dehydrogenase / fumarate reductase membrane anchor subunit
MNREISTAKPGEGLWLWLSKFITGGLIIFLIGVHLAVNHFVAEGGLQTYQDVIRYFSNPWIVTMEIVFLIVVVAHSLVGLRSVILDLNPTRQVMGVIDWALGILGVGSVVYGIWLALVIASLST